MAPSTGASTGRSGDLAADCGSCFGLCCVALTFARSADFPFDKPAGDPCVHLDTQDACTIHSELRRRGFAGCTVFDCFGAGQKVSRHTYGGRSWRDDTGIRNGMFAVFRVVRRLHELLWYLEHAVRLTAGPQAATLAERAAHVRALSDGPADALLALDVDAEYDAARPLLVHASDHARRGVGASAVRSDRRLVPGSDLAGARLRGADLSGTCLRGALLIGADLAGARLDRCDLLGADLRDADVTGADLTDAIFLTQVQVNSARGDSTTRIPAGLDRPAHWRTGC